MSNSVQSARVAGGAPAPAPASAPTPNGVLATTGPNGLALQNATPTIASWQAPNDGNLHHVDCAAHQNVTTLETGGAVTLSWTCGGVAFTKALFTGGSAAGQQVISQSVVCDPGSTVSIKQTSALTAGAAKVWASIGGVG